MKVRKKDSKVRGNLPFAPWRISISSVESPFLREVIELGQEELTTINMGKCNSNRMKLEFHTEETGVLCGGNWSFMRMKIFCLLEGTNDKAGERSSSCAPKSC